MALHDPKIILHFISIVLGLGAAVVPMMMPSVSCDADTGTNGIPSHDQNHVASHFNCFDLSNTMVPSMILLAVCDAGANGLT